MIDLDELRKKAEAASYGGDLDYGFPKINGEEVITSDCFVSEGGCLIAWVANGSRISNPEHEIKRANARFIAAANPAVVLELIAEIERLRNFEKGFKVAIRQINELRRSEGK